MVKQVVCKEVVPFPDDAKYVVVFEDGGFAKFKTLEAVAAQLRLTHPTPLEHVFIKNEVPGDLIWKRDDTVSDTVVECERLSRDEMRKLAQLL